LEEAGRYPKGNDIKFGSEQEGRTVKASDLAGLSVQVLDVPDRYRPVGIIDARYWLVVRGEQSDALWLYDQSENRIIREVIDYQGSEFNIGNEISFNERWLVWLEISPYTVLSDGAKTREVRLMVREIAVSELIVGISNPYNEAFIADIGYTAPADGFYLPFDNLNLDGDTLVYRQSVFNSGWRDTRVKVADLASNTVSTLGAASGASGRQILHCSLNETLVSWDVQINYQIKVPNFPPYPRALYNLHTYQLDSRKLERGESPDRIVTQHDDYYSPVVRGDSLFVLQQYPLAVSETSRPVGPGGSELYINHRTYNNAIAQIEPRYLSGRVVVKDYTYSRLIMEYNAEARLPRSVSRDSIHVGKRLLSWQSNIAENHIVFDLYTYAFVELPVFFAGVYDNEFTITDLSSFSDGLSESESTMYTYYPAMASIRANPIPGLDADYIYFVDIHQQESAYLLRVE